MTISYAPSTDGYIAYEVIGSGPLDLLMVSGNLIPIEAQLEEPSFARYLRGLASFSRLIRFDRRGTGLSDPLTSSGGTTLEQWMADASAVLSAVGAERVALVGDTLAGSLVSLLFAATYPDRTTALVVLNGSARLGPAPDYLWGYNEDVRNEFLRHMDEEYLEGRPTLDLLAPSVAGDEWFVEWWVRSRRRGASPTVARRLYKQSFDSDVRHVVPTIRVPTLVVHRSETILIPVQQGRWIADHIPGARFVELPGSDVLPYVGDCDALVQEVEEFLTGVRHAPGTDRVLATVLFTDIVDSTRRSSELGDRRWGELLDAHDAAVRAELVRFRGHEVKSTGDGFLATFDGPARAIQCALAIRDAGAELGLVIRAGLHTGEVEMRGDDVGGIAVNIGQRVTTAAGPGEVLVSRTVTDLVAGSDITFVDRGEVELKGVPGEWRLFAVEG
jgi:class 3 adenylate cyclase